MSKVGEKMVKICNKLDVLNDHFAIVMLVLSGVAIIAIAIISTSDTIGGQFLGVSLPSATEMQETLASIAIICAMATVQKRRENIVVDLFIYSFPPKLLRFSAILTGLSGCFVFGLMALESFRMVRRSVGVRELSHGLIDFPIYPFKILVFLGFVAALLQFVSLTIRAFGPDVKHLVLKQGDQAETA